MNSTVRQNTKVIVTCHSHSQAENEDPLNLSPYVINLTVNKAIKAIGTFSFTLVGGINWLNTIFPNDVINIYINPGDGERGYIRTMFGYIDRIERTETVEGETGNSTTMYTISGSDFTKAIEKTDIVFNPSMGNNPAQQAVTDIFTSNLGGFALRTKGVTVTGSPASLVENFLELLLGFGSQWQLPKNYSNLETQLNRVKRAKKALQKISASTNAAMEKSLGADVYYAILNGKKSYEQARDDLVSKRNEKRTILEKAQKEKKKKKVISQLTDDLAIAEYALGRFEGDQALLAAMTLSKRLNEEQKNILDIINFDFIEKGAMDGYNQNAAIWQGQGSLLSTLNSFSNENINELFFDLRAVVDQGTADNCFGKAIENDNIKSESYSTDSDELGVNTQGIEGFKPSKSEIKYVPAVVMREYPYSVVNGIDLSHYDIGLDNKKAGNILFGPIFAQGVEEKTKSGRYFYRYSEATKAPLGNSGKFIGSPISMAENFKNGNISPEYCYTGVKGIKHIDVIKIYTSDVKSSSLGRDDKTIYNYFTMYNSDTLGSIWKYQLSGLLPLVTPVSIKRNGLRAKEATSKFANYSFGQLCGFNPANGVDNKQTRYNLIRWTLLLDAWNQHNSEYLSGVIQLRPMPELRVGYRLDWVDRQESYYVESVSHQWNYPGTMATSAAVTRGQPNNPFPLYILPQLTDISGVPQQEFSETKGEFIRDLSDEEQLTIKNSQEILRNKSLRAQHQSAKENLEEFKIIKKQDFDANGLENVGTGGNRDEGGRLSKFFKVKNTSSVDNSVMLLPGINKLIRDQDDEYADKNTVDEPRDYYGEYEVSGNVSILRNEKEIYEDSKTIPDELPSG